MNDNIGGISFPKLISKRDVAEMKILNSSCSITLKDGGKWMDISSGKYDTSVTVNPEISDSGTLYSITATIQVPRQNMNDELYKEVRSLIKSGIIMSYKIFTNETFVIGTKTFPLKGKFETIQAQQPSGFSGYKITLTGKQTVPQLSLE